MNTKSVIKKAAGGWSTLEREKISTSELWSLINKKWTGKVKVIIQAPTIAGINCHIKTISDYQLKFGGGQIWMESQDQTFVITELTSVNYEDMNGRPNLQAIINDLSINFYFI